MCEPGENPASAELFKVNKKRSASTPLAHIPGSTSLSFPSLLPSIPALFTSNLPARIFILTVPSAWNTPSSALEWLTSCHSSQLLCHDLRKASSSCLFIVCFCLLFISTHMYTHLPTPTTNQE